MPREVVVSQSRVDGAFKSVEVGWTKDGLQAQLGVKWGTDVLGESQWVDLERHEINRLIQMLRKVRDSAYGADA